MFRAATYTYLGKGSSRGGATYLCEHVLFARINKQTVLKKLPLSSDCYLSLHHVTVIISAKVLVLNVLFLYLFYGVIVLLRHTDCYSLIR